MFEPITITPVIDFEADAKSRHYWFSDSAPVVVHVWGKMYLNLEQDETGKIGLAGKMDRTRLTQKGTI